jgi:hypothetical protein
MPVERFETSLAYSLVPTGFPPGFTRYTPTFGSALTGKLTGSASFPLKRFIYFPHRLFLHRWKRM